MDLKSSGNVETLLEVLALRYEFLQSGFYALSLCC